MLPIPPATLSRGGSPSTIQSTSPSDERETTDSTFSEIQVEVKVGDNGDIEVKSPVLDSMQRAAHNTPLPNGNGGDGGSGSDRPSPTPIRTRPEPYYSNEGRAHPSQPPPVFARLGTHIVRSQQTSRFSMRSLPMAKRSSTQFPSGSDYRPMRCSLLPTRSSPSMATIQRTCLTSRACCSASVRTGAMRRWWTSSDPC